jgi:hypothetical protein
MVLKLFKGVWFLSMLAVLGNMLYVYASLPEEVRLGGENMEIYALDRETFFYLAVTFITIVNLLVYLFSKKLIPNEDFRTWLHGLVITMNIFFIVGMSFISLFNSAERFDFERIRFIIYGSVGLVVLWAIGWPLYLIGKKLGAKHAV